MLSRRNVRIKVMQVLYALNRDKNLSYNEAVAAYRTSVRRAYDAYLTALLYVGRTADYARIVKQRKQDKLRPTEADRNFTAKFATNPVTTALLGSEDFQRQLLARKLNDQTDPDTLRDLYKSFGKTEPYQQYLRKKDTTEKDHRDMLLALFKHLMQNELFHARMDDRFANWIDDDTHVVGAVKKTLKALPGSEKLVTRHLPPEETVRNFGEELLRSTYYNDEELFNLVQPTLKNWDADRLAVLDMILLKMAISEFIGFPTVPTKVTLNEFVEVSKQYSTDKSKDFINGILDRLLKQLEKDGKINKKGRGLIT